jgi:hypothetical protein
VIVTLPASAGSIFVLVKVALVGQLLDLGRQGGGVDLDINRLYVAAHRRDRPTELVELAGAGVGLGRVGVHAHKLNQCVLGCDRNLPSLGGGDHCFVGLRRGIAQFGHLGGGVLTIRRCRGRLPFCAADQQKRNQKYGNCKMVRAE